MIFLSKLTASDWIGLYGAVLSTFIALVATTAFVAAWLRARRERSKFQTDLYFLRKIDRSTKESHPIVVALLANLGNSRIAFKSLSYSGVSENGLRSTGGLGWYEQPEELFGIRNRLLPLVLESGKTADLPMIEIGVLTRITDLKIWLTDFEDRNYYFNPSDIDKVRREIAKYYPDTAASNGG